MLDKPLHRLKSHSVRTRSCWRIASLVVCLFLFPSFASANAPVPGIQGSGEVDPFTGTYQYTVEFAVPPGRAGMQPRIALQYVSGSGGYSWVGHGWSLDLGTIERSGPRGAVASYNDETDEFYLGGQRLVKVAPNEYRTERDQFSRIRVLPDGAFEVTDPRGTVSVFGRSSNGRMLGAGDGVWRWLIEESTDANGNTMHYAYTHDAYGAVYPKQITYTGGNGFKAERSIVFISELVDSRLGRISYRSGRRVEWRRQLMSIETFVSGTTGHRYIFDYRNSHSNTRFLLASVGREDVRGEQSAVGYRFGYVGLANQSRTWREQRSSGWSLPSGVWIADLASKLKTPNWKYSLVGGTVDAWGFRFVEVNGDGYVDIVTNKQVYLNKGTCDQTKPGACGWVPAPKGTWVMPVPITASQKTVGTNGNDRPFSGGFENNASIGTIVVDVNGDRRADIIHANERTQRREVYLNNGLDGWEQVSRCRGLGPCEGPWVFPSWVVQRWFAYRHKSIGFGIQLANLNGDDLIDIMIAHDGDRRTYLGNGSGWTRVDSWQLPDVEPALDFVISGSTATGWTTKVDGPNLFYQGVKLMDVNGDGLDDLLVNSPNYDGEAADGTGGIDPDVPLLSWPKGTYLNNGAGSFVAVSEWESPVILIDYPVPRWGNFNGDELPDMTYWYGYTQEEHNQSHLRYGYANYGSNWVHTEGNQDFFDLPVPTYAAIWGRTDDGGGNGTLISDVNGDGWPDVVHARRDDRWNGPGIWLHTSADQAMDCLSVVVTPYDGITTITYQPSTRFDNPDLPVMRYVASSVTHDPGLGQPIHETHYSYEGGRLARAEGGFSGFAQVVTTDAEGAIATSYHQEPALRGRVMATSYVDVKASKRLSERHSLYGSDEDGQAPYRLPFSGEAMTLWDGDKEGRSTAEVTWFDEFGNAIEKYHLGEIPSLDTFLGIDSSDGLPESGDERTEVATFEPDPDAWILALPVSRSTYAGLGVSPQNRVAGSRYVYDAAGNLLSEDRWLEQVGFFRMVTQSPDDSGNIIVRTDAMDRDTVIRFDEAHGTFPVREEKLLGQVRHWDMDVLTGLVLGETDENGNETTYSYDGFGRLQTRQDPMGTEACPSESVVYRNGGKLVRRQVGGVCTGVWTETLYDGFGRQIQVRGSHPEGRTVVTTEYDARGKVARVSVPFLSDKQDGAFDPGATHWTTNTRDAASRLVQVTHPDGRYRTVSYGIDGSRETTDENNVSKEEPQVRTSFTDAYGNVVKVVEPDGNRSTAMTTYTYDTLDRVESVTDAQGNVISVVWDSLGRRVSMHDPDLGHRTFSYDLAGNLLVKTDSQGGVIRYKYDALDRQVRVDYGDDDTDDYRFDYDGSVANGVGRRTGMTDLTGSSGDSIFAYDSLGRVIREQKTIDGMIFVTQWRYDVAGRLAAIKWPNGEQTVYNYDISGALLSVNACVEDRRYNASGQLVYQEFTNGAIESYLYDEQSGRLQEKTVETDAPDPIYSFALAFDDVGNILTITDHEDSARTQTFTYDSLHRLRTASAENYGLLEYAYDSIGNMTQMEGRTFTYPPSGADSVRPHAVISDGSSEYTYDDNGNMTSGGGRSITYNLDDRPIEVTKDGKTVRYVYDGDGVRVKKTVVGGATTLYIGQFQVVK